MSQKLMQNEGSAWSGDHYLATEILLLKAKYKADTIIETGTYKGDTTIWMAKNFPFVHTIEVNQQFFKESEERLKRFANVQQYLGSTVEHLPRILEQEKKYDDTLIIFLDAHWYECPLLRELQIIADSGIKPVIAIHDFKNPHRPDYGFDTYPEQGIVYEWNYVAEHIEKIYGKHKYRHFYNQTAAGAKRGVLFVVPV